MAIDPLLDPFSQWKVSRIWLNSNGRSVTFFLALTWHKSRFYTFRGLRLIHFRFIRHAQQHQAGTHHHYHLHHRNMKILIHAAHVLLKHYDHKAVPERRLWRMSTTSSQTQFLRLMIVHTTNQKCKTNHRRTDTEINQKCVPSKNRNRVWNIALVLSLPTRMFGNCWWCAWVWWYSTSFSFRCHSPSYASHVLVLTRMWAYI